MDQKQKETALSIMKSLQEHPASASYFESKSQNESMIFALITNKLSNNSYSTIEQWITEVNDALSKESDVNEENLLNSYFKKIFNKLLLNSGLSSIENWSKAVYKLRNRIHLLNSRAPYKKVKAKNQIWNSEEEISSFMKAIEMMTSDQDRAIVFSILSENEKIPNVGTEDVTVDIFSLKKSTIDLLRKYMKQSLERRGIEFPNL